MMKKISVIVFVVLLFIVPLIGLIPGEWSWNPRLEATLGTTVAMICAVVLLNHLFGYMAGKAIAFQTGKRIRIAEFLISLPLFVPVLLLSFGLYLTWIRLGLADRFFGVLLVLLLPTLPYTVRLYTNGFQALGERMLEQMVLIEGNRFKRWFYLTGPMLRSTLQSVTLLVTVITISQYALVALIGGGIVRMISLEVFPAYSGNSQGAARLATLWLIGLPVLFYAGQAVIFSSWIRIVRRRLNGSHDTTSQ